MVSLVDKRFIIHIAIDSVFWLCAWLTFSGTAAAPYAENILTLMVVTLGSTGLLLLFAGNRILAKMEADGELGKYIRPKYHDTYSNVSTRAEIVFLAAVGWWWLCLLYALGAWGGLAGRERIKDRVRELSNA